MVYGWYRHRSLQATFNEHKLQDAKHHREHLVAQAKEAWKRKQDSAKGSTRMFFLSLNLVGYMEDAHLLLRSHHGPGEPFFRPRKTTVASRKDFMISRPLSTPSK